MRTIVFLLMLSAPAAAYEIVDGSSPSAEEQSLLQAVADETRDPTSVQFRNIRAAEHPDGGICGEINGQNGFGGYVGFRPFYRMVEGDGAIILPERDDVVYELAEITLDATGCL